MHRTKKLTTYSLLIALAMALSWLEAMVPLSVAIPGIKLGLPNLVVIFALYRLGAKEAWTISLIRVLLVSFTFGNAYAFWYSFAGAVLSMLLMLPLKKSGRFSTVGVSVTGGVSHNVAQIGVAMVVLENMALLSYLPVLMISGVAAGCAIGAAGAVLIGRVPDRI